MNSGLKLNANHCHRSKDTLDIALQWQLEAITSLLGVADFSDIEAGFCPLGSA